MFLLLLQVSGLSISGQPSNPYPANIFCKKKMSEANTMDLDQTAPLGKV